VTILVPRGAEAAAVRRARPSTRVIELPAGAACASALPDFDLRETVVVMGLCGSLRRLATGEVAIYGRVADATGAFELDSALVAELKGALPRAAVVNAYTADHVVTTAVARAELALACDADVVDMEGGLLGPALIARGLRFAMVRVVSDDPARDLPPLGDAIDAQGRVRAMPIALAFARAPLAAFAFVRDVRSALGVLTETARAINRVGA
jgi:adenosylhomocysteine nucleosidase